jgi:hypothetical protein
MAELDEDKQLLSSAEAMADVFFGWAKRKGFLPQPADDPADAFMAGAVAALKWAAVQPAGREFLRMIEREETGDGTV